MSNPHAFTLRKWLYDLLKIDYTVHDQIVERISTAMTTEKDIQDFGKLVGQIFHSGYTQAVNDCQKQLDSKGIKISIESPS
jgi:hypothetical protein